MPKQACQDTNSETLNELLLWSRWPVNEADVFVTHILLWHESSTIIPVFMPYSWAVASREHPISRNIIYKLVISIVDFSRCDQNHFFKIIQNRLTISYHASNLATYRIHSNSTQFPDGSRWKNSYVLSLVSIHFMKTSKMVTFLASKKSSCNAPPMGVVLEICHEWLWIQSIQHEIWQERIYNN